MPRVIESAAPVDEPAPTSSPAAPQPANDPPSELASTPSETAGKIGVAKRFNRQGRAFDPSSTLSRPPTSAACLAASGGKVQWPEVLRALAVAAETRSSIGDNTRSMVLDRYRAAGFGPDDFRNNRWAREAMADALTAAEGELEYLAHQRSVIQDQRIALRDVRRRLEWELWP